MAERQREVGGEEREAQDADAPSRTRRARRRPGLGRLLGALGRGVTVLLGLVVLVIAIALFLFTETSRGRDLVASFLERSLSEVVEGRVRLGPIVGGNLLTRAVVERFEIEGSDGQPFLVLESVHLEYDPLGFLRGEYGFRRMDIGRARIHLRQHPEGDWNFERIFPESGEEGDAEAGDGVRLAIRDGRLGGGLLEVRQALGAGLEGEERERAIAEALEVPSVWRHERSEAGWERVYRVEGLQGRFPLLRLVDPRLPPRLEMEDVSGTALAVSQPLEVGRFTGTAVFADTIGLRLADLRLPASRLSGAGWIVPGDPTDYRFELEAEPAGFADLQWLPLPVPEEGGGPMDLILRNEGEVAVVEIRDGEIRVRDTEARGGFAVALSEVPRFERLDLRLEPLRIALVDRLLDRPTLRDGYVTGRVTGQGRLDAFHLDTDLRLRPLDGADPSSLRIRGGARLEEPYAARELGVELDGFDLDWLALVEAEPRVRGRITGSLTLHGRPETGLEFTAELSHRWGDGPTSRVSGGGRLVDAEPPRVDVRLRARPLALALLDPYVPDLQLEGLLSGRLEARGTLADLEASAALSTERGELTFDGRFDMASERRRYDAEVVLREVDLRQWSRAAPATRLAVRGRVAGEGTDPADLRARFDLEVLPSEVAEAGVDTSTLRFSVVDGLATVDTFAIRTDVGEMRGRGSFGLTDEAGGALVVDLDAPDLSALNRWVVEGWTATGPRDVTDDLFADFPGMEGPATREPQAEETGPDTLAGSASARAVVFGNVQSYSFGGRLEARDVSYGAWGTDSLLATVDAVGPATTAPDSFVVNARAWEVALPTYALDSLTVRVERTGPATADVRATAVRDTSLLLAGRAGLDWEGERRSAELEALELRLGARELRLQETAFVGLGGAEGLVVRNLRLLGREDARLRVDATLPREGEVSARLEARQLPVAHLLQFLPDPPDLEGRMAADLRMWGTAGSPRMEARLDVERPGVGPVRYERLEGRFEYGDREVQGDLVLHGERQVLARAEGRIRANLTLRDVETRLSEDAFDLRVAADSMPLRLLEVALESWEDLDGHAHGEVRVTGGPGDLQLQGEAGVNGATARLPELGVRFVNGQGRARFRGSEARIDSLVFASATGGSAMVAGTVDLADVGDPSFDVNLLARGFRPIQRRDMRLQVDGQGHLAGSYLRPELTGRFRISNGEVRQDELVRRGGMVDLTDPDVYALIDTTAVSERRLLQRIQNPFMQNLQMEVSVDVGPDLWLRSEELNVEIAGEDLQVRMDRAEQMVSVVGTVQLVRGTYQFALTYGPYTQQLRIVGGTIEFVGVPGLNPNLDITAEYRTRTAEGLVVIRAIIRGTMQETQLSLESDPPLSESDQLCFLALGSPCLAAVDQRFGQRIARESALGILGGQISAALAADLGLDYLTLRTTGYDAEGGAEEVDGFFAGAFAGTELEVGRYVGNDIFLTVTQPLAGGQLPGWSVEWRFTDDWTLEARAENRFARRFGQVVGSTLEMEQTYGLFLFREWSF